MQLKAFYQPGFGEKDQAGPLQYGVLVLPNSVPYTPKDGVTLLGTFDHDFPEDLPTELDDVSHVLYHHVRDLLYSRGVMDMQNVTIVYETDAPGG